MFSGPIKHMEFEALRVSTSPRPKAKARGEGAPGSGTSAGRLPVLAPARDPGAASCLLQAPQPSTLGQGDPSISKNTFWSVLIL